MSYFTTLATLMVLPTLFPIMASASAMPKNQVEANRLTEFTLTSTRSYEYPFNDVTVDVLYTNPQGKILRVPAFWTGGNIWKVRYASPVLGNHTFISECSVTDDVGLHGVEGEVEVVRYHGDNRLYRHGPIRVANDKRHFAHADGTPFLWLGDTWWMGLCGRLHWPDEFQTLAADRKKKGFNVIQIAWAKQLFERYAWHHFEPHSEWATWDHHALAVSEQTPRSPKPLAEPYATGIGGKVRVVYGLDPLPILVQKLEPDVPYDASYFFPVTGEYETIGPIQAADLGTWSCPAPQGVQDWVLILEAPGAVAGSSTSNP